MKKALKIFGLFILLILILMLVIPYFYKDEINAFIKEDLNKNFTATIDYKDVSLSLFRDFPNLQVQIDEISVDGKGTFEHVSLANIRSLSLSLDAKKVFWDKIYEVKELKIKDLLLNLLVLKDGQANYDIVKENPQAPDEDTAFSFKIKDYEIDSAHITYNNESNDMHLSLDHLHHSGSGTFSDTAYVLQTKSEAQDFDFMYGVHYIDHAAIRLNSEVTITQNFSKYIFQKNDAFINDLKVDIPIAEVTLQDEDILLDIAYATHNASLKELLSLVPDVYLEPVADVQADGEASLSGFVKGTYNDHTYPAYEASINVRKGSVKYPDLPQTLRDVNVQAKVAFQEGSDLDHTEIDLSRVHFAVLDNQVDGHLKVKHPMTDPEIDTRFQSNMDLQKLKQAVKIPSIQQLSGLLDADFNLKGRLSSITQKKYDQFRASGFFKLSDFKVKSDSLPHEIRISKADLQVSPEALQLKKMDAQIGENDFHLQGDINNYIAWLLKKEEVLQARFKMHSQHVNLNDFMSEEDGKTAQDTLSGVVRIPKNIAVLVEAKADELVYKDLNLKEAQGTLRVQEQKANLKAVLLKTLDGQMELNGLYDTSQEAVASHFDVAMRQMSLVKSASTFSAFKAYAPVLQKIKTSFFSNMNFDVQLDDQMNPILETLKAQGDFNTESLRIQGIDVVQKIGELLRIKALQKPDIDKIKARFSITDGTLKVNPFHFKMNGMQAGMEGTVKLNKQMDFVLNIDVPREKLGANPNAILESFVGKLDALGLKTKLGAIIKMKFRIKGDYNHPKLLPAIAGYEGNSTQEIIQEVVTDKIEEVATEVVDKAREEARKQADKILAQARQQADSLVSQAQKLSLKLKQEAKIQADALINKAHNPLEKIGAKVAADKINQQAAKKGDLLVQKAQEKADKIMQKAQEKADKIIQTPMPEKETSKKEE